MDCYTDKPLSRKFLHSFNFTLEIPPGIRLYQPQDSSPLVLVPTYLSRALPSPSSVGKYSVPLFGVFFSLDVYETRTCISETLTLFQLKTTNSVGHIP